MLRGFAFTAALLSLAIAWNGHDPGCSSEFRLDDLEQYTVHTDHRAIPSRTTLSPAEDAVYYLQPVHGGFVLGYLDLNDFGIQTTPQEEPWPAEHHALRQGHVQIVVGLTEGHLLTSGQHFRFDPKSLDHYLSETIDYEGPYHGRFWSSATGRAFIGGVNGTIVILDDDADAIVHALPTLDDFTLDAITGSLGGDHVYIAGHNGTTAYLGMWLESDLVDNNPPLHYHTYEHAFNTTFTNPETLDVWGPVRGLHLDDMNGEIFIMGNHKTIYKLSSSDLVFLGATDLVLELPGEEPREEFGLDMDIAPEDGVGFIAVGTASETHRYDHWISIIDLDSLEVIDVVEDYFKDNADSEWSAGQFTSDVMYNHHRGYLLMASLQRNKYKSSHGRHRRRLNFSGLPMGCSEGCGRRHKFYTHPSGDDVESVVCELCQPGSYDHGLLDSCQMCPAGTYGLPTTGSVGIESCLPCGPGFKAPEAGSTECEECTIHTPEDTIITACPLASQTEQTFLKAVGYGESNRWPYPAHTHGSWSRGDALSDVGLLLDRAEIRGAARVAHVVVASLFAAFLFLVFCYSCSCTAESSGQKGGLTGALRSFDYYSTSHSATGSPVRRVQTLAGGFVTLVMFLAIVYFTYVTFLEQIYFNRNIDYGVQFGASYVEQSLTASVLFVNFGGECSDEELDFSHPGVSNVTYRVVDRIDTDGSCEVIVRCHDCDLELFQSSFNFTWPNSWASSIAYEVQAPRLWDLDNGATNAAVGVVTAPVRRVFRGDEATVTRVTVTDTLVEHKYFGIEEAWGTIVENGTSVVGDVVFFSDFTTRSGLNYKLEIQPLGFGHNQITVSPRWRPFDFLAKLMGIFVGFWAFGGYCVGCGRKSGKSTRRAMAHSQLEDDDEDLVGVEMQRKL